MKTAATIYRKIQDGVFDVSNEVSFLFDIACINTYILLGKQQTLLKTKSMRDRHTLSIQGINSGRPLPYTKNKGPNKKYKPPLTKLAPRIVVIANILP